MWKLKFLNSSTMNADNVAQIDYDRCIGCGLCEPVCPDVARSLVLKPKEEQTDPKENLHEQMARGTKLRKGEEFNKKQVVSFGFE